jgi:hypothetical protein
MRGVQTVWCEHCMLKGHKKDDCWFLHPHLRPKGPKKQGGDWRQGERSQREERFEREEKKWFVAENKENGERVSERVESNSAFKGPSVMKHKQIT